MKFQSRNDSGFVGAVFLAIALIAIVVASIAAMSRQPQGNAASQKTKSEASVVLKQGADFKLAIDKMLINGASMTTLSDNPSGSGSITKFSAYPDTTLELSMIVPSANVYYPGAGNYIYVKNTRVGKKLMTLQLLMSKLEHCQMINNLLYGDAISKAPALESSSATELSRPEGCLDYGGGMYLYYKDIVENAF